MPDVLNVENIILKSRDMLQLLLQGEASIKLAARVAGLKGFALTGAFSHC